jgi:hypothetical protein
MEAPMSYLMKAVLARNERIQGRVRKELIRKDIELLNINWPLPLMEKYYLSDLKEVIKSGEVDNRDLHYFFEGYVSLRNILINEREPYTIFPLYNVDPNQGLHSNKNDEKFNRIRELALEKGYAVGVCI